MDWMKDTEFTEGVSLAHKAAHRVAKAYGCHYSGPQFEAAALVIQQAMDATSAEMRERCAVLAVTLPKEWKYSGIRQRFDRDQMEFQRRTAGALIAEDIRALPLSAAEVK